MPSLVFSLISLLVLCGTCSASSDGSRFCSNEACNSLSATLLLNINFSVSPCENFYEYACGGFQRQARHDINDEETSTYLDAPGRMNIEMENRLHEVLIDSSSDIPSGEKGLRQAVRLTRELYKNCRMWMFAQPGERRLQNSYAIGNINSLLEHLLGRSRNLLTMSLEQLLARTAALGLGTIFDIGISEELSSQGSAVISSPDYANAPKLVIAVSTFNFTADSSYWKPMLSFLMLKNISLSEPINESSALGVETEYVMATIASEVKTIVESMQNLSQPFNGSLNALELELRTWAPRFNLSEFLNELLPTAGVNKNTIVEVDNMPMLTALLGYFSNDTGISTSYLEMQRVQRLTFLTLDAMLEFVDLLPPAMSPSMKRRPDSLSLKERIAARQCLVITQRLMEPTLTWLYRQRFHPTKPNVIEKVIEAMKAAFVNRIADQNWITEMDKAKIFDKVSDMEYYVGHQEFTDKQLASFYRNTSAMLRERKLRTEGAFGYTLGLAMKANTKQHLDFLTDSQLIKPSIFDIENPFIVNAYYISHSNILAFPLALLTPPIYVQGYPDFATYGAFATVVGHEIGHGFAEQWINNASLEQSTFMQLEPETQANYQQRVRCLRREFSILKRTTYWNETLAEDIADNMGLSAAYRAYTAERSTETDLLPRSLFDPFNVETSRGCDFDRPKSDWQRQQLDRLFFIMAAQQYCTKATSKVVEDFFRGGEHSSGPTRVNAMMRSSTDFARAFECPADCRMNPLVKCGFL